MASGFLATEVIRACEEREVFCGLPIGRRGEKGTAALHRGVDCKLETLDAGFRAGKRGRYKWWHIEYSRFQKCRGLAEHRCPHIEWEWVWMYVSKRELFAPTDFQSGKILLCFDPRKRWSRNLCILQTGVGVAGYKIYTRNFSLRVLEQLRNEINFQWNKIITIVESETPPPDSTLKSVKGSTGDFFFKILVLNRD